MNYYNEIKNKLIDNELYKKVKDYSKNKNDLMTYYEVGKLLIKAGKHYGDSILKKYSLKLKNELNNKYDVSYLNKMRKFYKLIEKMATLSPKLSYNHYVELLPYSDINKIKYYIKLIENNNLSIRQLREKIKNKEYERLSEETKKKIIEKNGCNEIQDFIKNPIIINSKIDTNAITEKQLKYMILENIDSFLHELGSGFSYIGNEYKIKDEDTDNYIDILLFNYIYNCFIVIELKVTKLKKEHIGQLEVYMDYINKNLKTITQNETIGIIIAREDNRFVMKYCSNSKVFATTYMLK